MHDIEDQAGADGAFRFSLAKQHHHIAEDCRWRPRVVFIEAPVEYQIADAVKDFAVSRGLAPRA